MLKDDKSDKIQPAIIATPEVRKPKNIRALVDEFQVDMKLGIVARGAQFFDYLAKKAPYQFCPPNLAFKAVMGMAKCPRETSEDTLRFRKRSSAIREALGRLHGRGFVIEAPLGLMRATVDDEDLATTQQVREVSRLRSNVNAATRTMALIKVSEVRDPAVRSWLRSGVAPLLKTLTEDDRIFRLMPAKPSEEE